MAQELHRDYFGVVSYDEAAGLLELEWLEGSANMTDADFKESMKRYAMYAEQFRPANLLVDVTKVRTFSGSRRGRVEGPRDHPSL